MSKTMPTEIVIWLPVTFGLLMNLAYLSITGFPDTDWNALLYPIIICGIIAILSEILFVVGIRTNEFSIGMPLLAFIPVFALIFAYLFYGEIPAREAGVGIALVVLGAYILGMEPPLKLKKIFQPLVMLTSSNGPRTMLAAAITGALIFVVQRSGVKHSSPVFFFTILIFIEWIFFGIVILKKRQKLPKKKDFPLVAMTGIAWGLGLTLVYASYHYTLAAYAASIMQLNILISIPVGFIFFREGAFKQRITAVSVMLLGAAIVAFYSAK